MVSTTAAGDAMRGSTHHGLFRHAPLPADVSLRLDTIRGLSAVAVLGAHANQLIVAPTNHALFTTTGLVAQAAVMAFFVLSGFLICKTITRNATTHGSFLPAPYAVDRLNRIIPPLLFSLLLVLVLWVLAPLVFPTGSRLYAARYPFAQRIAFDFDLGSFLGSAFFLNGFLTRTLPVNGPLWSLSYEVWYYVMAGLIASSRGGRGIALAMLVLLVLGAVNRTFLLLSVVWFAGALVALAHNSGEDWSRPARLLGAAGLACAAVLGWIYIRSGLSATSPAGLRLGLVPYFNVAIGIFFAAVLYEVVRQTIRFRSVASSSAAYSYTLYIIHYPILLVLYGVLQPWIHGNVPRTVVVAVLAALMCMAIARAASRVERLRVLSSGSAARASIHGAA